MDRKLLDTLRAAVDYVLLKAGHYSFPVLTAWRPWAEDFLSGTHRPEPAEKAATDAKREMNLYASDDPTQLQTLAHAAQKVALAVSAATSGEEDGEGRAYRLAQEARRLCEAVETAAPRQTH